MEGIDWNWGGIEEMERDGKRWERPKGWEMMGRDGKGRDGKEWEETEED